jgi:hypothetical protein
MKRISFQQARKNILLVWLLMSGAIFIIFLTQTLFNRYTGHVEEIWQWVFQYMLPAITLMLGVLIAQMSASASTSKADVFYYRLALGISWFFLALLFRSSMIVPLIHIQQNQQLAIADQKSIVEAFKTYDNILIPIQGIVMLCLGLFFTKQE